MATASSRDVWHVVILNERFFLLPIPPNSLAHLLARFLMRFGEMINAAIGEALMDEEEEAEAEEEDVGSWNCFC